MPFKSKAQRRKFAELLVTGDISEQTYEEWNRSTGSAQLPERLHPEPRRKAKKKGKGKASTTRPRKAASRGTKGISKKVTRVKARTKGS
jgi:hypothetical protein